MQHDRITITGPVTITNCRFETWTRRTPAGRLVAYRIEARDPSWLPHRIDGRWQWRVPHYALQARDTERGGWMTADRATTPESLIESERLYNAPLREPHREGAH